MFKRSISSALRVLTPLLYAVAMLGAPFHLLVHAAEASHWGDDCELLLTAPLGSGHGETHEACALCQGLTRIVGLVLANPSDVIEAAGPTRTLGNVGTHHAVPSGHDFQRGPPKEDFPATRA